MTTTEPKRTAELAGPPMYREDGDEGLGSPVSPPSEGNAGTLRRLDLRDFLAAVMRVFAEDDGAGKVLAGPFPMRAAPDAADLSPDILFVADGHLERLMPERLEGPADLAVQIAEATSWDSLRERYERAGVPEYWLLEPSGKRILFRALGDAGRYEDLPIEDSGIVRSRLLPLLWLRAEWLSAHPLPLLRSVLIEWGLPRLFAD